MRSVTASEFKAKCLSLMDEVAETREPIIITKRGKAVAKLTPVVDRPKSLFGAMKGQIEILGDIVSPLDEVWETER